MCFVGKLKSSRFKSFFVECFDERTVCFALLQLRHVRPKQSSFVRRKVRLRVFPEALCVLSENLKALVSNRFLRCSDKPIVCFSYVFRRKNLKALVSNSSLEDDSPK